MRMYVSKYEEVNNSNVIYILSFYDLGINSSHFFKIFNSNLHDVICSKALKTLMFWRFVTNKTLKDINVDKRGIDSKG